MRPPILFLTVAFGVGLWVGLDPLAFPGAALWGVTLPVVGAAVWLAPRAPLGAAMGVMGVAGVLWGGAALRERGATCAGRWSSEQAAGSSRAAIVRLSDPAPAGGGVIDAVVVEGTCRGALRLRWPEGIRAAGGTGWLVGGRWIGVPGRGLLIVRRAKLLDGQPRGRGAVRDRLAARTTALFGSRAALVNALVFAPNAALEPDVRERYTRSGLAHILSISGLHVGFLVAWLAVLLRRLPLEPLARSSAAALVLLGYLWLLGFPAPATRATVMLVADQVARLRQRVAAPRGVIALSALILVLADPWALHSIGAWLSVAAIGAVIWADRATARSPRGLRLVAPAVAATLVTAPITAFAFGTVAPVGVLANLVAIPVAAIAVPGLVIALALSWVVPGLAQLVAAGSGLGLALLDLTARAAAAVPYGHAVMVPGWGAAAVWLAIAAVAWWLWNTPRRPWLIAARVAFVTTVFVVTSLRDVVSLDECRCLTVHFLDVGQGDAALLRTPSGRWIVIDGGPRTAERDAGRAVVVPFLRRHGVERVALVVATHGHADHYGGLPAVLEAFGDSSLVIEPGEPVGEPLYLEFLAAVEGSGARWHQARAGDRFEVDGVALEVLSPDSTWMAWSADVNEHSVVLLVRFGGARLVFAGDAGIPVEAQLAGRVGDVDVLKVGHHGSLSATSPAWLAELRPERAVISVGARNRYGHPAPEVLTLLAEHDVEVLRTDRAGTVTLVVDSARARIDFRHHD